MDTVLLIEDDAELREAVRDGLEAAGYRVVATANGAEGLARFHEAVPDLVITDIVMAEKDGVEVILAIRERAADTPVIAISGHARYLENSRKLGATSTLLKPFRMPELLSCIETTMAR